MNFRQQADRNEQIIKFLTTSTGVDNENKPYYPTLFDAAIKFNLSINHIMRIKKKMIGLDQNRERRLPHG